jgi:hypothetical protein
VAIKFAWALKEWPALIAGDTSKAADFLATCRAVFESDDELFTRDNIFDKFNDVSSTHKEKLCRRYVRQQLGITFDRFLTQGEVELPAEVRARVFHELAQLDYGCEVLVFGFTRRANLEGVILREPHIIEIDRYGEVSLHQNFGAIGTGSVIAKSTLYQREQTAFHGIEGTLYHLYEASRLASKTAPGVGVIREFLVVDPPADEEVHVRLWRTTEKCMEGMEKIFQDVGPKPLIVIAKLGSDDLHFIEPLRKAGPPSDSETSEGQQ